MNWSPSVGQQSTGLAARMTEYGVVSTIVWDCARLSVEPVLIS